VKCLYRNRNELWAMKFVNSWVRVGAILEIWEPPCWNKDKEKSSAADLQTFHLSTMKVQCFSRMISYFISLKTPFYRESCSKLSIMFLNNKNTLRSFGASPLISLRATWLHEGEVYFQTSNSLLTHIRNFCVVKLMYKSPALWRRSAIELTVIRK